MFETMTSVCIVPQGFLEFLREWESPCFSIIRISWNRSLSQECLQINVLMYGYDDVCIYIYIYIGSLKDNKWQQLLATISYIKSTSKPIRGGFLQFQSYVSDGFFSSPTWDHLEAWLAFEQHPKCLKCLEKLRGVEFLWREALQKSRELKLHLRLFLTQMDRKSS